VEFDGSFLSEEAGTYYIAIHAVSDPDKWRLHVSKITVEPGADTSTPAAVTDLTAVPFEGALGAVLNFTASTRRSMSRSLHSKRQSILPSCLLLSSMPTGR